MNILTYNHNISKKLTMKISYFSVGDLLQQLYSPTETTMDTSETKPLKVIEILETRKLPDIGQNLTVSQNSTQQSSLSLPPVIAELSVEKLPPVGSLAYKMMVSKLMTDPKVDQNAKQLNTENLEQMKMRNAARVWKLMLNRPRHSLELTETQVQGKYSRVNMFTLLVGGKKMMNRRKTSVGVANIDKQLL